MKHSSFVRAVLCLTLFNTQQAKSQSVKDVLKKGTTIQQKADSLPMIPNINEQNDKLKTKTISRNADTTSFQIKGFIQFRYLAFQNSKFSSTNGFDVRRARLGVKGSFSTKWDYYLQVDFGGTLVKPLDLYMVYDPFGDYVKFTAGQFYIPFSLESLSSTPALELIDRSQVTSALVGRKGDKSNGLVDSIGNQNGRDVGLQASGHLARSQNRYLVEYYVAVLNGAGINTVDNNHYKDIAARIILHPFKIVDIGGSYYAGKDRFTSSPKVDQQRVRWGAELAVNYRFFSLKSEIIKGRDGNRDPKQYIDHEGGYIQASFFIVPKKMQVVLKYDTYDPNTNITNLQSTYYILGMNYFINKGAKIQLNYRKAEVKGSTNSSNDLFATQLQLQF